MSRAYAPNEGVSRSMYIYTDGQARHAAACLPTHGDTNDFALNELTGYPMAILSVNGETDGRETCIQGHRTWEYS